MESTAVFPPEAFDELARLEAGNFWFESRNKLILWALRRYFPQPENLLEIGCGTGFVLEEIGRRLQDTSIWGGEFFGQGLVHVRSRIPRASLLQVDATHIPFRNTFEIVCAFDVLEHIEADEAALSEIASALRPGGGLVLTVPQHQWLWSPVDDYSEHKRRYSRREMLDKLKRAGFRSLFATSFVTLLLPAMLLRRKRSPDPRKELEISPALNRVLAGVMACERLSITLGLRLPFGGSLLVVAQR